MLIPLPRALEEVLTRTPELSRAYLAGGCVRDALQGVAPKDLDVEVYGIDYPRLVEVLSPWGRTDLVGRSFGVVKLKLADGTIHDFSIPRRDSKVAPGHAGFRIVFDPGMTMEAATARRDFTINSMLYDPREDEILDFHGGREDLEKQVLRHTSLAFVEDPLRVLRGMQFVSRFRLKPAPETVELCRSIFSSYHELAIERVQEEWWKWAVKSAVPSAGVRFLAETGWVQHFPTLAGLMGVPQEPEWHPEGDVFAHTCHCCDALVDLEAWQRADETSRAVYMFAVLTHDFGKPACTHSARQGNAQRIVSPGHDVEGVPLAEQFLHGIHTPHEVIERVLPLVRHHMAHLQALNERAVRRLARRLVPETIEGLSTVITADAFGRPPKPREVPEGLVQLRRIAEQLSLQDRAPQPLLQGRDLIRAGMSPGKEMGVLLKEAFEAQLEGQFTDLAGAEEWLQQKLGEHSKGSAGAA